MKRRIPIGATLALVAAVASEAAPALGPAETIDRWLVEAGFQGAVLVARDAKPLLRKGYGMADREAEIPYTVATVSTVGSVTKQFTAAAILVLEMQGKLRVEDPLAKYLPAVPEDKRGITLHHLLTHTAGLDLGFARDYDPVDRDEYVRMALAAPLRSKPGDAYKYSNAGYSLLGAVVEVVSGKGYEKFLREELFRPAGMKETGYRLPQWEPTRIAVGYKDGQRWGRPTEKPWAKDGPYWALRANGGILSTVDDLWRWHQALEGETVLSAAAKKKMYERHVREPGAADSYYGYGWSISDTPALGTRIAHNGGNGVFYCDFQRFVDQGLVVILFTNDSTIRGARIAESVARLAAGNEVSVPAAPDAPTRPLGSTGREAIARKWIEAYNAEDMAPMREFRATYATPRPDLDEAERDRRTQAMRSDLGSLEIVGVLEETAEALTVRARSSHGPGVTLRFMFDEEGKVSGVGVEVE